jgi:phosphohistidine phosphatase
VRLYLVQHGEAKSEEEDPERPLTDRGASDVRRVVRQATGAGSVTVERIVHSGKTRAQQTAAAWGGVLGVPVEEADGLAPLDDPAIWAARVTGKTGDLMLVGHVPHLAKLAGLLLAGDSDRPVVGVAHPAARGRLMPGVRATHSGALVRCPRRASRRSSQVPPPQPGSPEW